MNDHDADRKKGIETLLVECRKFEAWLVQLEAKRTAVSPHVFERVRVDYTKRLDDARARLLGEADTLQSLVADLETRHVKEQDKVTKKSDERAEAELRAMVGELSEKEWSNAKSRFDSAIADLRAKFDGTERELADLKELLASVSGAPVPARDSATIVSEPTLAVADADPDVVRTPTVPATAEVTPPDDEVADVAPIMAVPAVSHAKEPAKPSTKVEETRADLSPVSAPTPRASQASRSLKCGECGTLNFPTEWYCERCGGELAAF